MITNKQNRRRALKMMLAGSMLVPAATALTGCGLAQSLPRGQSGGTTDGEPLSIDVRDALRNHPDTAQLQIEIKTVEDEIVLSGLVPNQNDVYNVELVAAAVPGVRHVIMNVYVNQ